MFTRKKLSNKQKLLITSAVLVCSFYLLFASWQNRRTIADYIPPSSAAPAGQMLPADPLVVVAVGDIACQSNSSVYNGGNGTTGNCRMKYTADLTRKLNPSAVLLMGDIQYENGTLDEFQKVYAQSWGALDIKSITRPSPGNHEYNTKDAQGYYDYFGAAAGDRDKGYYSFDQGKWHFIALNSNCKIVSCKTGSPQQKWLQEDLVKNQEKCTIAYWHHPLFSSGSHGDEQATKPLYETLVLARTDIVLNGHDHLYERFARQNAHALATSNGIRNFTVGTGGKSLHPFREKKPNSEARISSSYGVLKLVLAESSFGWEFIDEKGKVLDSGSDTCLG